MSARDDLVDIVTDVLYDIDQALPYAEQAEKVADALSGRLHAQCAVEAGGLERVGWQRPPAHSSTIHRLDRTPEDAGRRGEVPVYRLDEEDARA